MSTGTKICQGALQKIGAHTAQKPANPTSLENARIRLNSMISAWQDDDIVIGAAPLEAIGEELGEPWGVTNIIEDNLAILLQPDHEGSVISSQLLINANKGMLFLESKYQTFEIPESVPRGTMPLGQGNRRHGEVNRSRVFIGPDKTIGD